LFAVQHLDEEASGGINEIAQQLAFSDLILLNKTDLIDKEQLAVVQAAVRRINQSAQLLECRLNKEGGQPPLSLLLENNSFSVNKALQVDPDFLQSDSGSDLEISDTDSGSDSEDYSREVGAEGGGVTADTAGGNAAAGNAAAEPEASTATCCEHHQHKKQRLEQQGQQQAESSQITSQTAAEPCTAGPCSAGAKRQACGMADESTGLCPTKVSRVHQLALLSILQMRFCFALHLPGFGAVLHWWAALHRSVSHNQCTLDVMCSTCEALSRLTCSC
jgi:hypothetical protein